MHSNTCASVGERILEEKRFFYQWSKELQTSEREKEIFVLRGKFSTKDFSIEKCHLKLNIHTYIHTYVHEYYAKQIYTNTYILSYSIKRARKLCKIEAKAEHLEWDKKKIDVLFVVWAKILSNTKKKWKTLQWCIRHFVCGILSLAKLFMAFE